MVIIDDKVADKLSISPLEYQGNDYVYADYNATAPVSSNVKKMVLEVLSKKILNPSSLHKKGQEARKILQDARDDVRNFIGVSNDKEIVFTSGATEANNLVMRGIKEYQHVISAIEHPSILNSTHNPHIIPVNQDGVVDLVELEKILSALKGNKVLVSVMMANNETGVIQPIKKIVEVAHKFGAICHTDAAQSIGKIEVSMEALGVDLLTLSAHKFGGIAGCGVLIFDKKLKIEPMISGGGQEKGLRGGTENIVAIAGLSAALHDIPDLLLKINKIKELRDLLEFELLDFLHNHHLSEKPAAYSSVSLQRVTLESRKKEPWIPVSSTGMTRGFATCTIFGKNSERLPNTSFIYMPGVKSDVQLMHFDLNNIAVSNGSACSSGTVEPSHVLLAMGATKSQAECSVRISIGSETKPQDIKKIVECWCSIYRKNIRN